MPKLFDQSAYMKRVVNRELAIQKWLKKNNLTMFGDLAKEFLDTLDQKLIEDQFLKAINAGIDACLHEPEVQGLDFLWNFTDNIPAAAYGRGVMVSAKKIKPEVKDSSTNLPGIECKIDHGEPVISNISDLPVFYAVNIYAHLLLPLWQENAEKYPKEIDRIMLNIFELWNYKIAINACNRISYAKKVQLLRCKKEPFWVTITREESSPVVIAFL